MFKTGQLLYKLSIAAADSGVQVPVVGHCLGFELLNFISSEDAEILSHFDAEDIAMPLNFTSLAKTSRIFSRAPVSILSALQTKPTTMNNHVWGVSPSTFTCSYSKVTV